jgi:hypothetical protein
VTRGVRQAVAGPAFRDTRFMSELDVVFANLYFAAIAEGEIDVYRAPSAWRPLLRCRTQRGIARLQFALAGMNAHINRDLPQGIVEVFTALGGDPTSDATRRQDVDSVNALRERVEGEVKADFSIDVIGAVDVLAGRGDDVAATWNVRVARDMRLDQRRSALDTAAHSARAGSVLRDPRSIDRASRKGSPPAARDGRG